MKSRFTGIRVSLSFVVLFLIAGFVLQAASVGASNASVELQVKAAYLFNFGRYVSWPQQSGDVVIGVLGRDPIIEILEKAISGKTISGRAYRVKVFASAEQIDRCDILFFSRAEARRARSILAALSAKPVLTVSDLVGFANEGGMVEFRLIDDTLKFDINIGAAEKSGLRISSELLRVAHDIKGRHR